MQQSARFQSRPGTGWHEVVVESPDHSRDLATSSNAEVSAVLGAYRERHRSLQREGAQYITIFRNHGTMAGISLQHPHSQIVAMTTVPPEVRRRLDIAAEYVQETGRNLYRDVLSREVKSGERIILESEHFVAFQPFASSYPYETWIMPTTPQSSFGDVRKGVLPDLSNVLLNVLRGLATALDDPDYNYVIHSIPADNEHAHAFSWYLQIMPRLTKRGGFELATGLYVNPVLPEESAKMLKDVM